MHHQDHPLHVQRNASDTHSHRIGFLFNHEQVHQIPHSATVGFELARLDPALEVLFITSSGAQYDYLMDLAEQYSVPGIRVVQLQLSRPLRTAGVVLDRAIPFSKIMMLKRNLPLFSRLDVLVVPEKTSLLLRSHFGLRHLKFIYTAHGAGDRAIGFDRELAKFDLIFLAGPKIEQRMRREGILKSAQSCMVGYPKFDAVGSSARCPRKYFNNDRSTVLYNPHFDPELSSWYEAGREILDYFYYTSKYNLIFAPHIMLYTRRMHISPVSFRVGWVKKIPRRYYECPHMLIDTGSRSSTDMSYTLAADIYLGDVSSQIWEFLIKPRPCVFASVHKVSWQEDPNYLHWHTGMVFDDIAMLDGVLSDAVSMHHDYRERQESLLRDTFAIGDETASRRGAMAILEYLPQATRDETADREPYPTNHNIDIPLPGQSGRSVWQIHRPLLNASALIAAVFIIAALAFPGIVRENDEVSPDRLPAGVTQTILASVPGITILSAEADYVNGALVYEVDGVTADHNFEIEVTPDGTILEIEKAGLYVREERIALHMVSEVVMDAAYRSLPGFELLEAEIEHVNNTQIYELEGTSNGKSYEIELTAEGIVIEIEDEPGIRLDRWFGSLYASISGQYL